MLRNEIEKITEQTIKELTGFPSIIGYGDKSLAPLLTDRICKAIGKAAEGMQPMVLEAEVDYLAGYTDCWNDCQDYWRKQVE